jgi:hypothetical protein
VVGAWWGDEFKDWRACGREEGVKRWDVEVAVWFWGSLVSVTVDMLVEFVDMTNGLSCWKRIKNILFLVLEFKFAERFENLNGG